ncbi:glycosyltransferase 87 family protein [Streptomyces sp. GZWMJZ-114]|uniref:glycosyltransferase 87 family protein n=1 Tax=Streptomyces sp. GZWMJZ-114 TaxID=2494734 RepID=UPI001011E201|nr:glycosyltransferase 87 family protein [Streptomyces sp. GZWMJZ-114]
MSAVETGRREPAGHDEDVRGTAIWWVLLALLAAGVAVTLVLVFGTGLSGADIAVYRGGGKTLLDGDSLYDYASSNSLGFTYPPFMALLFTPLGLLSMDVATVVWAVLSVAALEAVLWIVLGAAGVSRRNRLKLVFFGTLAALTLAPVSANSWTGQINNFLMLFVVADLVLAKGRWRGVGIGIAAGIKLTPLIFIPYLLMTRQLRAALTAAASFAGTVLVGFVFLPGDSSRYWFDAFLDIKRVIVFEEAWGFNQSMLAVLRRLPGGAESLWLPLAVIVGIGGLLVAAWATRRGHELAGILACALTGLIISPVSWPFHWVWFAPLLVLCAVRAWRSGLVTERIGVVLLWLALAATSYWTFMTFFDQPIPAAPNVGFGNLFVPVSLVVLAALAVYLRNETSGDARPRGSRGTGL